MARILIADDEDGVRSYLAEALEREGHTILPASDGAQAAQLLDREGVDLVLSDLKMPGMDGLELIEEIRSRERRKKIAEKIDSHLLFPSQQVQTWPPTE